MMTDIRKRTVQAIVNLFETGHILGDYSAVTVLEGDSGRLTYGRSQASLTSGSLYSIVAAYCETPGASCAERLRRYLPALLNEEPEVDEDTQLHRLLRAAGEDPVMRRVQDEYFDRAYWTPATSAATALGLFLPLSIAIVYDSHIHGSWSAMRRATFTRYGDPASASEKLWTAGYVDIRRAWLESKGGLLARTVYRMDTFRRLIREERWNLELPMIVRGRLLDESTLGDEPTRASAGHPRVLRLGSQGPDVEALQRALGEAGATIDVDGNFGPETEAAVRVYQKSHGLVPDARVGPATRASLGIEDTT